MEERLSSTNAGENYVTISVTEQHGFMGHEYRDPKPFSIREASDDKVINIYANFPDKKPFVVKKELGGGWLKRNIIVDVGTHVEIPEGYALYVFTDEEIERKGIKLYEGSQNIFMGRCFPFELCLNFFKKGADEVTTIKIEDGQLVARGCIIRFPKVDTVNFFNCERINIDTNIPCKSSCISGGSGWTKPINSNSIS